MRAGEIAAGSRGATAAGVGGVTWRGAGAGEGGGGGVLGRAKRADGLASGADTTLLMTLSNKQTELIKHCAHTKIMPKKTEKHNTVIY